MKKHSGTILLVLIFFVGLAVMLYPTISDYINQRNQTRVVNSYAQQVDGLSDADYTAYFDAADVFNQEIAADPDALYHADHFSTYSTTLDVTGTGSDLSFGQTQVDGALAAGVYQAAHQVLVVKAQAQLAQWLSG